MPSLVQERFTRDHDIADKILKLPVEFETQETCFGKFYFGMIDTFPMINSKQFDDYNIGMPCSFDLLIKTEPSYDLGHKRSAVGKSSSYRTILLLQMIQLKLSASNTRVNLNSSLMWRKDQIHRTRQEELDSDWLTDQSEYRWLSSM